MSSQHELWRRGVSGGGRNNGNRRAFFQQMVGVAGATVIGPTLQTVINAISPYVPVGTDSEAAAAELLVAARAARGPFSLQGQGVELLIALLGAFAAIVELIKALGILPEFRRDVSYRATPTCRYEFQDYHARWRQNGYQAYAGVSCSPVDEHMMILSATDDPTPRNSTRAEMVGLYSGYQPLLLSGREPGVIHAGLDLACQTCSLSASDRTGIVSITDRVLLREWRVWSYRNALGGYILYYPDETGVSPGSIAVHVPGKTDNHKPTASLKFSEVG
jgi:hypothetical protein